MELVCILPGARVRAGVCPSVRPFASRCRSGGLQQLSHCQHHSGPANFLDRHHQDNCSNTIGHFPLQVAAHLVATHLKSTWRGPATAFWPGPLAASLSGRPTDWPCQLTAGSSSSLTPTDDCELRPGRPLAAWWPATCPIWLPAVVCGFFEQWCCLRCLIGATICCCCWPRSVSLVWLKSVAIAFRGHFSIVCSGWRSAI